MGLFKKKERIEAEKNEAYSQTVSALKKKEAELVTLKQMFETRAREAKSNDSQRQYELALAGYRLIIVQLKQIRESLFAFESALQIQENAQSDQAFLTAFVALAKDLKKLTGKKEYAAIAKAYAAALPQAEADASLAEAFLKAHQASADPDPSPTSGLDRVTDDWVEQQTQALVQSIEGPQEA